MLDFINKKFTFGEDVLTTNRLKNNPKKDFTIIEKPSNKTDLKNDEFVIAHIETPDKQELIPFINAVFRFFKKFFLLLFIKND